MAWPIPLPPETGDEVADLAAFAAWEQAVERHYYPGRFDADGVRLPEPREFTFYVGAPEPSWLNHCDGVPKFVSAARFDRYRSEGEQWPVTTWDPYAIDSGAYIALDRDNYGVPWWQDRETYASKILTYADNSGPVMPDFCAPQDMPCEPNVRKRTGMTVDEHQDWTTDSYEWLVREWPWLPWIPVLQGWEPEDYLRHRRKYEDRGIDLAACHRVGIGSICRRGHLPQIVEVIEQFADSGLKLHGFGIKKTALPAIGHLLRSADSMAWSFDARYTPVRLDGCTHTNCANCYRYAKLWREQVLASLPVAEEADMPAATTTHKPGPEAVIALADAEWGMYGQVKGFGHAGDRLTVAGYVTKVPRIHTGGVVGSKKFTGKPMLSLRLFAPTGNGPGGCSWGIYALPDAVFTVLDPPADRPNPVKKHLCRRVQVQDLRRGDVFYIWDEPGRSGADDRRPRYHVQTDPEPIGDYQVEISVLVEGKLTTRSFGGSPHGTYADVEDPRKVRWQAAPAPAAVAFEVLTLFDLQ